MARSAVAGGLYPCNAGWGRFGCRVYRKNVIQTEKKNHPHGIMRSALACPCSQPPYALMRIPDYNRIR